VIMILEDHAMMIIKICNITMIIMEDASNGWDLIFKNII
jgi:hypothetical protein